MGCARLAWLGSGPGDEPAQICVYKCGVSCAQPPPNQPSGPDDGTGTFAELVATVLSRRAMLGVTAGLAAAIAQPVAAGPAAASRTADQTAARAKLSFSRIDPVKAGVDSVRVPSGFEWAPVISWGDPILPGAPSFDFHDQSSRAQAGQFGYNNDFTAVLPLRGDPDRALLVCNHEYTDDQMMQPGFRSHARMTEEQARISMAAHGMSVVEIRRDGPGKRWTYVRSSAYNRRVTATTPIRMTGPAAGSRWLRTSEDPSGSRVRGTFANCSGGRTPWGTVLSGEENFDWYFVAPKSDPESAPYDRYGIMRARGRGWQKVERRFDLDHEPHEANRFGWVVELDPTDPGSTPRKHTALGRLRHEAATTTLTDDGRVAVYMGDDTRFEYVYKFVSRRKFDRSSGAQAREHNLSLLTEGDLYVARFSGRGAREGVRDGTGTWMPLVKDGESRVPGFSVDEVLVWTRSAADKVSATKMDRPEDVETDPATGRTYVVCTNNSRRTKRQTNEVNPRADNVHGHIVEMTPDRGDHGSTRFDWKLVLIAGRPGDSQTYFAGHSKRDVDAISCPDNLAFDGLGNVWIATNGNQLGQNDGLYMMPLTGSDRGLVRQFLSVPAGAECTGPSIAQDGSTVFVSVQHPGELSGASPTRRYSTFPYDGTGQPRPSVIQVRRSN